MKNGCPTVVWIGLFLLLELSSAPTWFLSRLTPGADLRKETKSRQICVNAHAMLQSANKSP